jgi:excisionase family DNA binding protein
MRESISPDEWISQSEAARLRGVSRQAICGLVERKRLTTLEIGSRLLVRRKEIEQFKPNRAGRRPSGSLAPRSENLTRRGK